MPTRAPNAASPMAVALPMPPVPPVTRTDFPAMRGTSAIVHSLAPERGFPEWGGDRGAGGGIVAAPADDQRRSADGLGLIGVSNAPNSHRDWSTVGQTLVLRIGVGATAQPGVQTATRTTRTRPCYRGRPPARGPSRSEEH